MKKQWFLSLTLLFLSTIMYAASSFVIEHIEIQGLQGISRETVLSYLPIKVGDRFEETQSAEIIKELYRTGFFDRIDVSKKGNTLIIQVAQRPIISHIKITGNKNIPTKKLLEALQKAGFGEGQIFDQLLLDKIKGSLAQEYFTIGKYNATIDTKVTPEPRNRVSIKIAISEGKKAKIRRIKIIGNYAFHDKELLDQFKLSASTPLSFLTHKDQYSREKLEADLESLHSYYMDHGYLKFKIDSTQVSMSPDRSAVYITIHIIEGIQYKLGSYQFSGELILPKETLDKLANLKVGKTFSRQEIMFANKRIINALGNKGYAGADVQIIPTIDDKTQTVSITFSIRPGAQVYVRKITFSENYRTNDEVLRRALLQREGSILSTARINESKRSLLLLPYIRDVQVTTTPVPGKRDQVDVNYKITEQSSAELRASLGYSKLDKLFFSAGINHPNALGTGNSVGLNFLYSRTSYSLGLSYYNPYHTKSGIGRSFNLYATHFNADKANITDYATNSYGASIGYSIPFTHNNRFHISLGYEDNELTIGSNPSQELTNFVTKHGKHAYQLNLTGSWTYQGLDRGIFPTKGFTNSLGGLVSIPVSKKSLEYYRISYSALYYQPLYRRSFVAKLRARVGYGNGYDRYEDELPFYKNFYAGGMGSVRGYTGNTLGPLDSKGEPIGGNFVIDGTAGLIFPNPIGQNLRTTLFIDGGNVYHDIHFNNIRYAAGIEFDWLSPMGMLNFSFAKPLNKKPGDEEEIFQFNIGTML